MAIRLKGSTSGSVELDVPAAVSGGDVALTLPNGIGSAEQFLKNSGTAGELEFSSMVETSTGVGIGTSSPQAKLDVNGNAVIGTDNVGLVEFTSTGVPHFAVAADASNYRSTRINVVSAGGYADLSFDAMGTAAKTGLPSAGSLVGNIMYLDASTQNVGIGTTSPSDTLHLNGATGYGLKVTDSSSHIGVYRTHSDGAILKTASNHALLFGTNDTERLRIDSSGNVGVGVSSPLRSLHIAGAGDTGLMLQTTNANDNNEIWEIQVGANASNHADLIFRSRTNAGTGGSEAMRIDSSGRLLVGTTTEGAANEAEDVTISGTGEVGITLRSTNSGGGRIYFSDGTSGTSEYAGYQIYNHSSNAMIFGTNAVERMRIVSSGNVLFGQTSNSASNAGAILGTSGNFFIRSAGTPVQVNRLTNDGELVSFRQADNPEGSISVSGSTVSYNGAHLSRWSQLADGAARTEILRGSVLSNLDEMCEWGEEDNEQLNRMQVSSVEGDRNVSGVFQCWDDDDDTYVNDFYCAMTGDFVIRIAQGTTVARGDLLMSAGDGTAKPQDDDIVRSKTIAKVTSTTVSETYSDNSYCVPCVLMAC